MVRCNRRLVVASALKQSIGAAAVAVSVKMNSPLYSKAAHQKGRSCQLSGAELTRHSFAIGRLTTPFLVRTETVRTQPLSSGNVCRMRPTNHWPLGAVLSTNKITSPSLKLRCFPSHFERSCSVGKYSRIHRTQNWSVKYWMWRHRLRA